MLACHFVVAPRLSGTPLRRCSIALSFARAGFSFQRLLVRVVVPPLKALRQTLTIQLGTRKTEQTIGPRRGSPVSDDCD
jgi:hypothetical protein